MVNDRDEPQPDYFEQVDKILRPRWFDRQGNRISFRSWVELHEDVDYVRVAHDEVDGIEVSTVWLGENHRFVGEGPPIIFESLVSGGPSGGAGARYCTEAEAMEGHAQLVRLARMGI